MDRLSAAKGSNHFANSKTTLRILTMSLLSIGVVIAGILAYQQFTKPAMADLISNEEAAQIALAAGKWNEQTLRDKEIETTLLHVKANGFSFIVKEETLLDTLTLHHNRFPEYEGQYLWAVEITSSTRDWSYLADAETGEILLQP